VSALVPGHNPFDAFFNHVMADPKRLAAMPAPPLPRRFSQALAGTFAGRDDAVRRGVACGLAARRRVLRRVDECRRPPILPPGLHLPSAVAWNSRHALSIAVGARVNRGRAARPLAGVQEVGRTQEIKRSGGMRIDISQVNSYGAGVRPWRRMISAILTRSGGPPAAAFITSATS
jgi:hypothetical protein